MYNLKTKNTGNKQGKTMMSSHISLGATDTVDTITPSGFNQNGNNTKIAPNNACNAHVKHRYYREFAYISKNQGRFRRNKSPIRDNKGFELLLQTFSNCPGQYTTVYSFSELDSNGAIIYESAKIDRIYLDFDCKETPQYAIDEALLVTRTLTANKIYPRFYFSGNKGIAMYIEFITTDIKNENKKPVIAAFFNLIKDITEERANIKLKTLDTQVRGDIARVSRLPNTQHASGYYCIPITIPDLKKGIEHIKQLAVSPREDYDLDDEITTLMMKNSAARQIILNLEKKVTAERNKKTVQKKVKQHKIAAHIRLNGRPHGSISDKDIETAKNTPLAEIAGRDKKSVCPLHPDTMPSLSIDFNKNLWHCFGCGRGGTPIDYVMERDNLNFIDAVKRLNTGGMVAGTG